VPSRAARSAPLPRNRRELNGVGPPLPARLSANRGPIGIRRGRSDEASSTGRQADPLPEAGTHRPRGQTTYPAPFERGEDGAVRRRGRGSICRLPAEGAPPGARNAGRAVLRVAGVRGSVRDGRPPAVCALHGCRWEVGTGTRLAIGRSRTTGQVARPVGTPDPRPYRGRSRRRCGCSSKVTVAVV